MASYERQERSKKPNVAIGLGISALVHAALIAGAVLLHKNVGAEPEIRFRNIVEAKLVRLGTPEDEKLLPRIVAPPPPPPPDPGAKVTTKEEPPPPEPVKKKERPREREEDLEQQLLGKIRRDTSNVPRDTRRASSGAQGVGDPRGDPEGEVVSAKDQVQGSLWAAQVRKVLHRAWAIPDVIPDSDLRKLVAIVRVRIDSEGNIRDWKLITRATGSPHAGLFNGSVNLVSSKVRSLPPPPPGALKVFKGGWVALRFSKAELEKSQ